MPDRDWRGRILTWREAATQRWDACLDRQGRIESACRIARNAFDDSLAQFDDSLTLSTVRRTLNDIVEALDSDHEQSTESDNEEVSETD